MSRIPPTEVLQEAFCDELEQSDVLARRYDLLHRERLTEAGHAIHSWLASLDFDHLDKAQAMTLGEFANAYARAAGGFREFAKK